MGVLSYIYGGGGGGTLFSSENIFSFTDMFFGCPSTKIAKMDTLLNKMATRAKK